MASGQGFPRSGALAGSVPSTGLIFSPTGGTFGGTQYVGLSYPTDPTAEIFFTLGPLCTPSSCPTGSSVLSYASALYTGPNCIPTSSCTSSAGGFGTPIKAPNTGSGTTINALVAQAIVSKQNIMSNTALPASWFPNHWKFITPNTLTSPTGGLVNVPTTGTCGVTPCTGNILKNTLDSSTANKVCYATVYDSTKGCTGGGVGSTGTVVNAWIIPNATAPVTPPTDPLTGLAALPTYMGYSSSSQSNGGWGGPQTLYTATGDSACATFCTWMAMDFWILADGGPYAAIEADMQMGESSTGSWTFALQCRTNGPSGSFQGWGQSNQTNWPPKLIPGTTAANCPNSTQWLHVMYYGTRDQTAKTFTIVSLALQSVPGGPAGASGYSVFPVNVTYAVDPKDTVGNTCTNQMQIDAWCAAGGVCNTTQHHGAFYALNNVTCGTGIPPVVGTNTQLYH